MTRYEIHTVPVSQYPNPLLSKGPEMTETAVKKNWELLLNTFEKILDNPESWDQANWATTCGTAYCFAGHAALLAGGKQIRNLDLSEPGYGGPGSWTEYVTLPEEKIAALDLGEIAQHSARTKHGLPTFPMSRVGREALGLTIDESDVLFRGSNTIEVLYGILQAWMAADCDGDHRHALYNLHDRLFYMLRDKVRDFVAKQNYKRTEARAQVVVREKLHEILDNL